MIRVLHVISGLGVGGAETVLAQLAPALAARGIDQHVVSLTGPGPFAERLAAAAIPLTLLDLRQAGGLAVALPRLIRLVRRFRPGILQGWMYHGDLAATFAHRLAGGRHARRLFWGVRCSDMDLARHARLIRIEALLSRLPDAIVANSAAGAAAHLAHGYRPRRLEIVANGIDTARFRPDAEARAAIRKALAIDPGRRVAIHVARVDPMKDHARLLEAFAGLPDVQLVLAGADTETLLLPPNARALGVRDDVPSLLAAADIAVSSSAFGEGFSNALAEGMSAGLAPVATDVGDTRLIVGDTGPVVPPRDAAALREAVRSVADTDDRELAARGLRARAQIVGRFAIEPMIDRFDALYRGA